MDSLELIKTFSAVAERGTFTQAARCLHMSKATVSKQIAALERRFDVRLLNRTTRAVSLTDAGRALLERSAPLIDMAAIARSEMQAYANRPRGRLRVSAPYGLERTAFPDILSDYMRSHPDVHIHLRVTNARVDLVADGCDIAFRLGRVQDDNLIVRRLVQVDWVLCATPGYWARAGIPQHPEDVRAHEVLTLWPGSGTARVPFEIDGRACDVPVRSRMESNEPSALIGVALNGLGAVAAPAMMASPHLERGALVPVLKKFMPRDIWFHAAYTQRRHNSAALRSLLGHMESRVGTPALGLAN